MPRPCKRRRICALPGCVRFGPAEGSGEERPALLMTVDEFETVRLIDLEGLTQEECARQMAVARTTAQAIYNSARLKLARCLVHGLELRIGGGDYELCQAGPGQPGCGRRCGRRRKNEEERQMKIAVTYENGQVFQHFGHTEQFKIYDVENGQVTASVVVGSDGSGHGALAGLLQSLGVDTLVCGGIGGGARMALEQAGIRLFGGVAGEADAAVAALLSGGLRFDPDVQCSHHEHHDGACGEHGCGGHQEGGCGGHSCGQE